MPQNLSGWRVLVVDDNPDAREMFRETVRNFGFGVDDAASAREAIALMQGTCYDLLICDWKMPEMDGVQLVRAIQQNGVVQAPRAVIMVSAYGVEELRQVSADLVLAGILPKPARPSAIYDAIVAALGQPLSVPQRAEALGGPGAESIQFSGEAVLLVEDNPINLELANELLTSVGLSVTVANNGREALECLDKAEFACVLMDVQMPEMDGLEATRHIRLDPRFKDLPVIAMTAGAMAEEREDAVKAGMNGYLTKPINVAQMFVTIDQWLKRGKRIVTEKIDDLGALPGLDVEFGLTSVFNKLMLYRKLLSAYVENNATTMAKFDDALRAGNRSEINRLAHTMRGASGTLGMHKVYEAAAGLEKLHPGAAADLLSTFLDRLKAEQAQAVESIEKYLAS